MLINLKLATQLYRCGSRGLKFATQKNTNQPIRFQMTQCITKSNKTTFNHHFRDVSTTKRLNKFESQFFASLNHLFSILFDCR